MISASPGEGEGMTAALPEGLDTDLVRRQHVAVQSWRAELGRLLSAHAGGELPEAERMVLRGWLRTRAAVDACLVRQARGEAEPLAHGPRAVVVHRDAAFRAAIEAELVERGLRVLGGGKDGAVAVALAVVEQPDLLVLDDELAGLPPLEVVAAVRRFAPRSVLALQLTGSATAPELLQAGATFVFERDTPAGAVCARCTDALSGGPDVSPARRGADVAG